MAWVDSEYASELSVVAAWLAALVPWSVSVYSRGPLGSRIFAFRFPLVELQVRAATRIEGDPAAASEILAQLVPGTPVYGSIFALDPLSATFAFEEQSLVLGGAAWLLGALVVLTVFALSLALYRDEAAVAARLQWDEVRVVGVLLMICSLCFAAASGFYFLGRSAVGIPIPIGVIVVGALAVVLLQVERV